MKSFFQLREEVLQEKTMELAGATLQNMEHCPGAVSAFKQNLKDGADEKDVVKAAKAVDAYLAIEDKAKKSGATEADVTKMKGLIDNAKSIISDLGLKGHTYHDMHLDKVKDMINEAVVTEKATSQAQQKAAGAALAAKRGEADPDDLVGASKEMYDSMSEKELDDFASTKHKGLPKKKEESDSVDEISLAHMTKKIANSGGMKNVAKANKADKTKKDLAAMRARLAATNESYEDEEPASEDEKSMAMRQAKFIKYVGDEIEEYLEMDKEFPEWMQNKLSAFHQKAKDVHSTLAGEYDDEEMNETKGAPKGFHFNRRGQLKRGDAGTDGPGGDRLRSDPLDKQRSKIPPVTEAKPDAVEVMRRQQQMKSISKSDQGKLSKVRQMLDREKKK